MRIPTVQFELEVFPTDIGNVALVAFIGDNITFKVVLDVDGAAALLDELEHTLAALTED